MQFLHPTVRENASAGGGGRVWGSDRSRVRCGRVRIDVVWARPQGKLDQNAGFDDVQAMIKRPLSGRGAFGARLEPDCLRASGYRIFHYERGFKRRHDHIDDRRRFGQVGQAAVGFVAFDQLLAAVYRIDRVASLSELQIDAISVLGLIVAGPHNGPNRFVYILSNQGLQISHCTVRRVFEPDVLPSRTQA